MSKRVLFSGLLGMALVAAFAGSASAYIRLRKCGTTIAWPSGNWPLSFVIANTDSAGGTVSTASKTSLRLAFSAWDGLTGTAIDLNEDTSSSSQSRTDWEATDIHLVFFDDNNSSSFFPSGSGAVAVTAISYAADGSDCPVTGAIVDGDILINSGGFDFGAGAVGVSQKVDLQNVITHEIGHFIGLDHVPVPSATMTALTTFAEISKRSLSQDDISAAAEIRPSSGYGTVSGTINRPGSTAAAYPYVVALDSNGNVIAGSLGDSSGVFSFSCPAGSGITVYAGPYYGTMGSEISQAGTASSDFSMSFYGTNDAPTSNTVTANATLSLGTLTTNAIVGSGAEFVYPLDGTPSNWTQVVKGSTAAVSLAKGSGVGTSFSGLSLEISNPSSPDLTASGTTVAAGAVSFTASAGASAVLGLRDVRLADGSTPAKKIVSTGAIEVVAAAPTISSVTPALGSGNGGDTVTIAGTGFAGSTTTQKVLFGDTLGTVTAVSATSITVTTPAHDASVVDVGIINPDGQGVVSSSGFTFGVSLTSVNPTSVCHTKAEQITLTGTGFESGTTVTVNGTACTSVNIVSSTSLTANLPVLDPGTYSIVVTKPDTTTATLANAIALSTVCGGGGGGCFGPVGPTPLPPADHMGLILPFAALFFVLWVLKRRRVS